MSKKAISLTIGINLLIICIAIWFGGQNTWKLLGFKAEPDSPKENLVALEEILNDHPDEGLSKYNLAVVHYRQNNYQKAADLLKELVNSGKLGADQRKIVHYNLGNSYFRLSENSEDLTESIELLEQSLLHYRTIIDQDRQQSKYTDTSFIADEDAQFNYVLVRAKLKLLNDKLRQQQTDQANEKQLYQLLKELREKEKKIAEQLGIMKNDPLSSQSLALREELLEMRKENYKQLQIIKEKLLQSVSQQRSKP
ncbi:MAG: tetratricopeptide repeat protein [Proteobacteria bacterium]|nr:tetratricopeptide repeat protein [Pseudomonadota bacterium]